MNIRLSTTERNLWSAFLGEAMANRKYVAYGMKALEEGYPEIAQVFFGAAGGETAHALQHLKVLGEIKSTTENLAAVVEGEAYEMETMYPRMIREAEEEGRADAIASFRVAMEGERHHLAGFQQALRGLAKGGPMAPAPVPKPAATPVSSPARRPLELARTEVGEVHTEKERIAGLRRIREVVFGAQDGLLTIVALAASVMAAVDQTSIVIIAGLAGGLAGMISMASGTYLASKAEQEVHIAEIERERRELEHHPGEELAELIEIYRLEGMTVAEATRMAEQVSSDRERWLRTLVEKELGLSPDVSEQPVKDAAVMGVSYLVGAAVPLLPYFFLMALPAVLTSVAATLGALFLVGFVKGRVVRRNPWLAGLEIVLIGSAAAILGYVLGTIVPGLLGVQVPS